MECELLSSCGFFQKHFETKELACAGFIRQYCQGAKMDQCARKKYREEHSVPPPDDMLPNGTMMAGTRG